MPDNQSQTPPIGTREQADQYLDQIIHNLKTDRFPLIHSDLSKFGPGSFQDHYRIDLGEYHAEVSHSKHPQSGNDIYSLIFTNVDKIRQGLSNQAILGYLPLTAEQFNKFRSAADRYFEDQKRREEQKRFRESMQPIDTLLGMSRTTDSQNRSDHQDRQHRPDRFTDRPQRDHNRPRPNEEHRQNSPQNRSDTNHPATSEFFHEFTADLKQDVQYTPPMNQQD